MKKATLLTILFLLLSSGVSLAADYALVVNRDAGVSSLSSREAKDIFLGRKGSWGDGSKVTVFIQPSAPFHQSFLKEVVGKNPQQFSLFWKKALFTGQGIPPAEVPGDEAMKKRVSETPGSIGYISRKAVDDSVKGIDIK